MADEKDEKLYESFYGRYDHLFEGPDKHLPAYEEFYAKAYFDSLAIGGTDTESFLMGYAQALYDARICDRFQLMSYMDAVCQGGFEHSMDNWLEERKKYDKDPHEYDSYDYTADGERNTLLAERKEAREAEAAKAKEEKEAREAEERALAEMPPVARMKAKLKRVVDSLSESLS